MKLFTKTFGCQMNFADSDEMGRHFYERGFQNAATQEEANVVMVNTCTVRDLAEHKAVSYIGRLKDWKGEDPNRMIVVTGCAAERAKKELFHRFPHIDLLVGAKDIEKFPQELNSLLQNRVVDEEALAPSGLTQQSLGGEGNVIQFTTIMRGCNYNCSYCIVPSVRGREKYIPIETIKEEVKTRLTSGAKEIWLLGQTVNSYRPPNPPKPDYDFSDLLRDLNDIPGQGRLRFISPHPYYVGDKLMAAMAECEHVCEYLHLPVQSGSTKMLKAMKRNYTRDSFLKAVEGLRKKIPTIGLTTDIIVGFPGETKADFKETLTLIKEADFGSAYCFKYSPRPGTESAKNLKDDVSQEEKEERLGELLEVVENLGLAKVEAYQGTIQEVLVEEVKDKTTLRGKTRNGWKTRIFNTHAKLGDLLRVKITGRHLTELHAEEV